MWPGAPFPRGLPILLLSLSLITCGGESGDWRAAERAGTVAAYQEYLAAHAAGRHGAEAAARIEEMEYWSASGAEEPERRQALEGFLDRHPGGRYTALARTQLIRLDFDEAMESGIVVALERFAARFPASPLASRAEVRAEELLAGRPDSFRALRTIRVVVETSFVERSTNEETGGYEDREFDPGLDFPGLTIAWLSLAAIEPVVDAGTSADGELRIEVIGVPRRKLYSFLGSVVPVSRYTGAELSGAIRLTGGAGQALERRFHGVIPTPRQISLEVPTSVGLRFVGSNAAEDAPFARAMALPGSILQRAAELACEAFGVRVLAAAVEQGRAGPLRGLGSTASGAELLEWCRGRQRLG